jgi:hydrogenase expression/formation protein HypC
MCLAIPGRLENITDEAPLMRSGEVSFGGIRKSVNLAYTPEAQPGDYVLVHVGFALSIIDDAKAKRMFEYLDQIGEIEEQLTN